MRVVVQRVKQAAVDVHGEIVGQIGRGLLILLGVSNDDDETAAKFLADKLVNLRIFSDDAGKMNLSVADVGGGLLVVSQFTLYGDCRKGRRPSFVNAAGPDHAIPLYEYFVELLRASDLDVQTGRFGEMMDVSLVNDGPVTFVIDS